MTLIFEQCNRTPRLPHGLRGLLGRGVDGERECLGDRPSREEFHRTGRSEQLAGAQRLRIIGASFEFGLDDIEIQGLKIFAPRSLEPAHLRLAPQQRNLASFKPEPPSLPYAGLLTFGPPSTGRTAAGTVAPRDALDARAGTGIGPQEVMKRHRAGILEQEVSGDNRLSLRYGRDMHWLTSLFLSIALFCPSASAYFRLNAQVTTPVRSSSAPKAPVHGELQQLRIDILKAVNAERAKKKLPTLTVDARLESAAQAHAEDMAKRKFFNHVSPEGGTPEMRIRATGYFEPPCAGCSVSFTLAENIAKGPKTAATAMKAWMGSPVHRNNILKADIRHMGLGYSGGVWVQVFGRVAVQH